MEIVRNPQKYGQTAELGLFIPVDELMNIGGIEVLERAANSSLRKAEKRLEFYQDIQDSGEATRRQQTSLDKWQDITDSLHATVSSIVEAKKRIM